VSIVDSFLVTNDIKGLSTTDIFFYDKKELVNFKVNASIIQAKEIKNVEKNTLITNDTEYVYKLVGYVDTEVRKTKSNKVLKVVDENNCVHDIPIKRIHRIHKSKKTLTYKFTNFIVVGQEGKTRYVVATTIQNRTFAMFLLEHFKGLLLVLFIIGFSLGLISGLIVKHRQRNDEPINEPTTIETVDDNNEDITTSDVRADDAEIDKPNGSFSLNGSGCASDDDSQVNSNDVKNNKKASNNAIIDDINYAGEYLEVTTGEYVPLSNNIANANKYQLQFNVTENGNSVFKTGKVNAGNEVQWFPSETLTEGVHNICIEVTIYKEGSNTSSPLVVKLSDKKIKVA